MQYVISRRRDRSKWIGIVLAAVLVLFTAGSAVAGAAVTKDQIYSLKAQAADLNQQKAGLQKDINKLSQSKHEAVQQKLLLEQKLNVLRRPVLSERKYARCLVRVHVRPEHHSEPRFTLRPDVRS